MINPTDLREKRIEDRIVEKAFKNLKKEIEWLGGTKVNCIGYGKVDDIYQMLIAFEYNFVEEEIT